MLQNRLSINLATVEAFATDPATGGSQAHVGRKLREAGYSFANNTYRKLWDVAHGKRDEHTHGNLKAVTPGGNVGSIF